MQAKREPLDAHITWAADYCKHCFICINICPVKNLKFKADDMVSLNKCIQCQLCEKYCPDFALEVEPKKKPISKETKRPVKIKASGSKKGGAETARRKTEAIK
jgi:2-oxoglutarate ferredoxin oxidoreductase subunit delta